MHWPESRGRIQRMRKYILPAVLSATVCPGLGQMVKGEVLKGVLILLCLPVGLFLSVFLAILASVEVGIVLGCCVVAGYLWSVYDAYSHGPRGSKEGEVGLGPSS